ncbi:hypothetical protein CEXT_218331 [Caerostris extrusa]|uniref:Uncharacterized protein n=1 Tax=Caerostris extrusa TaxID=172846 RepID=A0AAV4UIY6_CAEEX|nr:hypothetical protein CEXT_218331 [Caerostris extrusa]
MWWCNVESCLQILDATSPRVLLNLLDFCCVNCEWSNAEAFGNKNYKNQYKWLEHRLKHGNGSSEEDVTGSIRLSNVAVNDEVMCIFAICVYFIRLVIRLFSWFSLWKHECEPLKIIYKKSFLSIEDIANTP